MSAPGPPTTNPTTPGGGPTRSGGTSRQRAYRSHLGGLTPDVRTVPHVALPRHWQNPTTHRQFPVSIRAVLWALELAPVTDPTRALVLVGLCERANDDGRGSWPTVDWLANAARIDRSGVKRHLRELQKAGLIAPIEGCADPRWLRLRADRRPRPWAIAVPEMPAPGGLLSARAEGSAPPFLGPVDNPPRGGAGAPSSDAHGGAPVPARGGTGAPHDGALVPPRHIKEEPEGTGTDDRNARARATTPPSDGDAVVIDLRGAALARAAHRAARAHQ